MNRNLKWVIATLVIAAAVHLVTMWAAPYGLMALAFKKTRGAAQVSFNQMTAPQPVTEKSRAIVRPSPDLAYSSCVYDLSKGPVRIKAAAWDDYMSLSIFEANTDMIFVRNDREAKGGDIDITLARAGQATPAGREVVISPSMKGIALVRRLAPSAERFEKAAAAAKQDVCKPI